LQATSEQCTTAIVVGTSKGNLPLALGLSFVLVSPEGQAAIGGFRIAGEQLFHPSARTTK